MSSVMARTHVGGGGGDFAVSSGESHQLLSGFQFFLLCLVVAASYYVALFISARAVGESTASLGAPFAVILKLFADVGNTILKKLNRRRNNTQVGAASYEEVANDSADIFTLNQPAAGAQ